MHRNVEGPFSAEPILKALAEYQGTITDLDSGRTVDGSAIRSAVETVARQLGKRRLRDGDRVVLSVGNGPQFFAAIGGVLAAGGSPLLLHGDTPAEELRRHAQAVTARFVLSESCLPSELETAGLAAQRFQLTPWLGFSLAETRIAADTASYFELPGVPLHPSSGTTGQPKVAVRPASRAVAEAAHYIDTMAITADDTILCVVPMSHAYGYGMGFMVPVLSGARLLTSRQFSPPWIQRALVGYDVTILPAVPALLNLALLAWNKVPSSLRLVLAAGAPLSASTAAEFRRRMSLPITPLYGTTETGGIAVAVGESELAAGCVGRPMEGVEAEVQWIEGAPELAPGVGRLRIRSRSMMAGYLTPEGIDGGAIQRGWFTTGDLASLDACGRIHLFGREKEVINVFGMKVLPSEVEGVIAEVPRVREVKVYAGAHRLGGDIIKAAVAGEAGLDVAAIRSHCEAHLATYKRPHVIHLMEMLPRSPLGKILPDRLP